MANAPFGQFPGDFESLARQYWNTWNELLGRGGMPDAWGLAGAMPPGLGAMGMGTGTYDWYQRMQRLAADFSGGGSAADVAGAWREMMGGQAADPFAGMLRSMHGGLAGGDWLEQMRPLLDMLLKPLRQHGAEWLQRPAFGPAREHQERLQALALAWQQWEQSNEAFNAQLAQAGQVAFARFEQLLEQHDAPGKRLESARALFDLWIDAAEDAWAEVALSAEYRHAYAEMTNALMRLRLKLQQEVEQFGALLGLPGRSELDALHRKVAELDRALHAARRANAAPRAAQAPAGRASAEAAAQAVPARTAKPAPRRAARPVAKAAAPGKKKPARRSSTRAVAARVGTGVVAPVKAQEAKAAKAAAPARTATKPIRAAKKATPTAKAAKANPAAKKPGKATATRTSVTAKPAATSRRKPAAPARKPTSAAKGKALPATPADMPRTNEATHAVGAAARKPAGTASRRAPAKAAAKRVPQASTSTARKARVAKAGSARGGSATAGTAKRGSVRKAQPATVPAAAGKVVSMKDWVSRNLAATPAGSDAGGGKRRGRSR